MFNFNNETETKTCENCGYKVTAPFPQRCPKCNESLEKIGYKLDEKKKGSINVSNINKNHSHKEKKHDALPALEGNEFSYRISRIVEKRKHDDKTKEKLDHDASFEGQNLIFLSEDADYLKMMGVINTDTREKIFCSNTHYEYILELGLNAHEIASSILGGTVEKILFEPPKHLAEAINLSTKSKTDVYEEAIFLLDGNLLFCIYGTFYKRPDLLLKQLKMIIFDQLKAKYLDQLSDIEKHQLQRKASSITNYILKEYMKIRQDVLRKATVPTLEKEAIIHYLGLSYQTIGAMALLITKEGENALPIKDIPFEGNTKDGDYQELIESLISAKIEAIAANTFANTGSFPRYIITKINFDSFRMFEFIQLKNNYILQLLGSGNAEVIDRVINKKVKPIIQTVIEKEFSGILGEFNVVKSRLMEIFGENYKFNS
ncbi:MAG: hypothetical protein ACTSXU_03305 [Promethearchaeota archaeon]